MAVRTFGEGSAQVLCLHETGTSGVIWQRVGEAIAPHATLLAPDRQGWGASPAPEGYARTTIHEQTGLAGALLAELGAGVVCGAGIGAVIALDLALTRPELVRGAVLIEPPLLSYVPEATDQLAIDAERLRKAIADGGRGEASRLWFDGGLTALGAGAGRIPAELREDGPSATASLFAELAAVPAWEFTSGELAAAGTPAVVATSSDAPVLIQRAASGLASELGRGERRQTDAGHPATEQAAQVADLIVEVCDLA